MFYFISISHRIQYLLQLNRGSAVGIRLRHGCWGLAIRYISTVFVDVLHRLCTSCNSIRSEISRRNIINQRKKKPIWVLEEKSITCVIAKGIFEIEV